MYNLRAMLNKALEICAKEGIPYGEITGIKVNDRITKALGRCTRHKQGGVVTFSIDIKRSITDDKITPETGIMSIICHEIIHTCEGCFNHGKLFNSYGERLKKYGYDTQGTSLSMEKFCVSKEAYLQTFKYQVRCKKCGNVWGKNRMDSLIKYPSIYSCKCGGTLERIK